jgi:predicted transcriptional regulator
MIFDQTYATFLQYHLKARSGERLRRLKEGHSHAEKLFLKSVWWPSFGHFNHLHPEYEVNDFKDGKRYLDFAYIRLPFRACFEVDGFGPHWRDISRWQFADNQIRQNHLVIDGWRVIRFAYDDVKDQPRRCQQVIQQLIGRWLGEQAPDLDLGYVEREIIRMAVRKGVPITPGDVGVHLEVSGRHARKLLSNLVSKQLIRPDGGTQRIRSYIVTPKGQSLFSY